MSHFSTDVRSAGVDTLTCTCQADERGSHMVELARQLQLAEARHDSKLHPFKRAVYSGVQSSHVGWAEKKDRVLVELRGRYAYDWWRSFVSLADKVSRLDVQVSVRQKPYDHDMALRLYLGEREHAQQRGRPSTFRMQGESDGGTTLYIGTGASRYQARLYERWYKEQDPANEDVWRYELQARRDRADQLARLLVQADDPERFVSGAVHRHFLRRGVAPIFAPASVVSIDPLPKGETDREKSLRWLGSSVSPVLDRHRAWGSYNEAVEALGIKTDT